MKAVGDVHRPRGEAVGWVALFASGHDKESWAIGLADDRERDGWWVPTIQPMRRIIPLRTSGWKHERMRAAMQGERHRSKLTDETTHD